MPDEPTLLEKEAQRQEMPPDHKLCPHCKRIRHRQFFQNTHPSGPFWDCKFCRVRVLREVLAKAESELNSFLPPGRFLQEPCRHCKVMNWWLNLEEWKTFEGAVEMWCPACRYDDHEKKYYLRTQEAPKITSDDLMETLKNSGLLD